MPFKKGKKGKMKKKTKVKGKGKKALNKAGNDSKSKIQDDIIKLEYPVRPPLPTGQNLINLLTTHKVSEKELYNQRFSTHILEQLTPAEIRDLKFVFDTFDVNTDGYILALELKNALRVLGFTITNEKAKEITMSAPHSGFFSLCDFLTLVIELQGDGRDDLEEILKGFDYLDLNKCGEISVDNVKHACAETGLCLSHKDIINMVEEADLNGDGLVDKGEFVRIIRKTNLY